MDLDDLLGSETILRNFRIAAMIGSFSNLIELNIGFSDANSNLFFDDIIDAIKINGFQHLVKFTSNISLNNLNEHLIFSFIDSISKHCLHLQYLILPFSCVKRKKGVVQAAFFGNSWPSLKTIPQYLLQVPTLLNGYSAIRYAILESIGRGSAQFPSLKELFFIECSSTSIALQGLCLARDMSHIKELCIAGRALRNPFLNVNLNESRFSGVEILDISALEFPKCPANVPLPVHAIPLMHDNLEYEELKSVYETNTKNCKKILLSTISNAPIESLKLGLPSISSDIVDLLSAKGHLKLLKKLEIIGRNSNNWYHENEIFCEQTLPFVIPNSIQQLRDGGRILFGSYFEGSCHHDEEEYLFGDDVTNCIRYSLDLLQNSFLRANLKCLVLGGWLEMEAENILDLNEIFRDYSDEENDDNNDDEKDEKDEEDEEDKENKEDEEDEEDIDDEIIFKEWAQTFRYLKNLDTLDLKLEDSYTANTIIERIIEQPPQRLTTIRVHASNETRASLYLLLSPKKRQRTIDHWFPLKRAVPIVPLKLVYVSDANPLLADTIIKFDIKRFSSF